jgi:hypothetical protein
MKVARSAECFLPSLIGKERAITEVELVFFLFITREMVDEALDRQNQISVVDPIFWTKKTPS